MTDINVQHVPARRCHPQGAFLNNGIQAQHSVFYASPSLEIFTYYISEIYKIDEHEITMLCN